MAHTPPPRLRTDTSHAVASAGDDSSGTDMRTRQPENVIRTLKMPLLRADVDERQQLPATVPERTVSGKREPERFVSETAIPQATPQRQQVSAPEKAKSQTRPAPVVQQLKHCLAQYELLQKQLLCAELTGTASPDHHKFEQAATKLVGRITSLRKQLAAKRDAVQRTMSPAPVRPKAPVSANNPNVVQASKSKAASAPERVPAKRIIKLSVGQSTAMVLKAFADAGKRPSALVERALWADSDVKDAALLLNLKPPTR